MFCRPLLLLLLPCVACAADDGLVGRWRLERAAVSGDKLRALTGADGRIAGTVNFSTQPEALSLDGKVNSVRISDDGAGLPAEALSVEAWIAPRAGGPWGGVLGCLQDNGDFERGWMLGYKDSKWCFAVSTGKKLTYLAAPEEMRMNRWTHLAGTFDGTTMRVFVDGREVAASTEQKGAIAYAPAPFVLGAYEDQDERYPFDGLLREAALWRRALPAAEIAKHFVEGRAQFPPTMESVPRALAGPWVRFTGPDSAVVKWETFAEETGAVEFGETTAFGLTAAESKPVKQHEVTLRGLKPQTVYFYRLKFGGTPGETLRLETDFNFTKAPLPEVKPYPEDELTKKAREIAKALEQHIYSNVGRTSGGYILDYGCGDGRLAWEIARLLPNYSVLGVSSDAAAIAEGRKRLDAAGVYGNRITLLHCDAKKLQLNDNNFDWIVSSDLLLRNREPGPVMEMVRVLKPGTWFRLSQPVPQLSGIKSPLTNDSWQRWFDGIANRIEGWESDGKKPVQPLPPLLEWDRSGGGGIYSMFLAKLVPKGAGAWSHAYGDAGQTANSGDLAVSGEKLGLQWFGEPGARGMMDRQPRSPPPLCVNGVFYIQGNDRIFALDAWNGAMLWTLEIPGLRRVNLPRDSANMCADKSDLYVAVRDRVLRIGARSGEVTATFAVQSQQAREWSYLAVVDDQVFGSAVKPASAYTRFEGGEDFWYDKHTPDSTAKVVSDALFSVDRMTGTPAWNHTPRGVILNSTISIGGGRVYFLEARGVSAEAPGRLESPDLYRDTWLVALDAATGKPVWEKRAPIADLGTAAALYLCYSDEKLVLLDSASKAYHTFAFSAKDGAKIWRRSHPWTRDHHGGHLYHPVIVRGMVVVEPFAYDLASGSLRMSGMPERGGCTTLSAAANCLHFINWDYDKGSMYVWDLDTQKQRQFSGSRGNCWLSFISGSGMVLLPAASGGCTCRYPNQVTLGFAPGGEK